MIQPIRVTLNHLEKLRMEGVDWLNYGNILQHWHNRFVDGHFLFGWLPWPHTASKSKTIKWATETKCTINKGYQTDNTPSQHRHHSKCLFLGFYPPFCLDSLSKSENKVNLNSQRNYPHSCLSLQLSYNPSRDFQNSRPQRHTHTYHLKPMMQRERVHKPAELVRGLVSHAKHSSASSRWLLCNKETIKTYNIYFLH